MLIHRKEHRVPGLNTTSTADISFMLLIFFLVTTNMDIDKGLPRQLPPASKQMQQESFVSKGTMMAIRIDAGNRLFVDDKPSALAGLRQRVESFVTQVGKRHIITLYADPKASYDTYFHVQNELIAAYNNLRDKTALKMYGRKYGALTQKEKDRVKDVCPQRIAEQYPAETPANGEGGTQ